MDKNIANHLDIVVTGHHIDKKDNAPTFQKVKEHLAKILEKYFSDILNHANHDDSNRNFREVINANVHFNREGTLYICDIIINYGGNKRIIVKHKHSVDDIYLAFIEATFTLENQIRKYKSRIKDRHHAVKISTIPLPATKYVINTQNDEEKLAESAPNIVAEKAITIESLSVDDAIMTMDLENLPALIFQNIETGRMNFIYHRKDGNISWVDSK